MPAPGPRQEIRLAELMAAMSLATDISMDQPMEEGVTICLLATRLAGVLGLSELERVHVYYGALLRHIGCTADMHVLAAVAGDDISMRSAFVGVDLGRPVEMFAAMMRHIGRTYAPLERPMAIVRVMAATGKFRYSGEVQCEVAEMLASRLGFDESFQRGISGVLERWDGRGFPGRRLDEALRAMGDFADLKSPYTVGHSGGVADLAA